MMDCSTARLLLAYSRPKSSELETWAAQALNDHTAECSECAFLAQDERQLQRHLGLAMRQVAVPENLRERLLLRLQVERRNWYRRLPARHPRLAAAVAALLLLAVGLGVYAAARPLPALDLPGIAEHWNSPASAQDVQKFFEQSGLKVVVPPEFNYQYLDSYDLQTFAGRLVPCLHFQRGPNYASVYILSASQFDLRAAIDQPREGSGRFTVELRLGPANSNVAYLIKYTGGSLDGFLQETRRSAT